MIQLPLHFQCPKCNSFNSQINNIRARELESQEGMYNLSIDLHCCDCGANYSHKFAVSVDETNSDALKYLTGQENFPSNLCFCTNFDGVCKLENF